MSENIMIIDNGSYRMKVGIAGEEEPRFVDRTLYGEKNTEMGLNNVKDFYIGRFVLERMGILKISEPIKDGLIWHYDQMTRIYQHIFTEEMHCNPEEYNFLLTESPYATKEERCKKAQIFFETLEAKSLCIQNTAALSAYNYGKFNCCVANFGYGKIDIGCVKDGYLQRNSLNRLKVGGDDVIEKLFEVQKVKHNLYNTIAMSDDILCTMCYVPLDYEEEKANIGGNEHKYRAPDGSEIEIGLNVIDAPEVLFKRGFIGTNIKESIMKIDNDLRKENFGNIIIAGGLARLNGLGQRVKKEVLPYASGNDVNVICSGDGPYAALKGASMFAMISGNESQFISKEDYEEHGMNIINKYH